MNTSPVEPYLRRDYRTKKFDLVKWVRLACSWAVAALVLLVIAFAFVVLAGPYVQAHAAERTYSAIIKDGGVLTPQEFCDRV